MLPAITHFATALWWLWSWWHSNMAIRGFFSFTQAKLLFMAIRRLLFPEATVSQTGSYCLTAGLWCRAQTLSPTPPPPPPLLLLLLLYASLLVLRAIIFIWKPIRGNGEKKRQEKEMERGGEGEAHRETECSRGGKLWFFWSCDRCYQHVSALHIASKEGSIDLLPYFNQKKWVLNPRFSSVLLWTNSVSLNKDAKPSSLSNIWKKNSILLCRDNKRHVWECNWDIFGMVMMFHVEVKKAEQKAQSHLK